MNVIGKRKERKQKGYPRISGADGRTPLPVARGVKAVPMHRERSPRWGLNEENGEMMGMRRMPKSGGEFVMQDAVGKSVRARSCPELSRRTEGGKETMGEPRKHIGGRKIGIPESAAFGPPDGMGILKSWGDALTGLRNVLGGLPRASLADSLCPGLTSVGVQYCPEIGCGSCGGDADEGRGDLSSLPGLAPGFCGQPTVGNGGLLSDVPTGLLATRMASLQDD